KVETEKMKTLRDFLKKLRDTREDGVTLLDRTTVFFSSTWATPARTASRTCRCCSPGAASNTAGTSPSTRRATRRCATSLSRCSSASLWRWTSAAAAPAPCQGWKCWGEDARIAEEARLRRYPGDDDVG